MKPGEHPEFFRLPPPEGRSRESTIKLDSEGRFWHDGELVEHSKLASAMHGWISRHPDDGRYILTNGYDWTYFKVEDAPYHVVSVDMTDGAITLVLSDGTKEPWDPARSRIGDNDAVYTMVKAAAPGGPYEARFSRHAQASLATVLIERDGAPAVKVRDQIVMIGS